MGRMPALGQFSYSQRLTADQYKARANLVRSTAANTTDAVIRRQLLVIAEECERLADDMGRSRYAVGW